MKFFLFILIPFFHVSINPMDFTKPYLTGPNKNTESKMPGFYKKTCSNNPEYLLVAAMHGSLQATKRLIEYYAMQLLKIEENNSLKIKYQAYKKDFEELAKYLSEHNYLYRQSSFEENIPYLALSSQEFGKDEIQNTLRTYNPKMVKRSSRIVLFSEAYSVDE